jgi:hypothetical protein
MARVRFEELSNPLLLLIKETFKEKSLIPHLI